MLGTDLLTLRRNQTSTVATLLGRIEQLSTIQSQTKLLMRTYELNALADAVLANVAVYALESYWGDTLLPRPRRASVPTRRPRRRRSDAAQLHQRLLFA